MAHNDSSALCECGCGAQLTGEPRFLKGHNACVNPDHLEMVTHPENMRRIHAESEIPEWSEGIELIRHGDCLLFPISQADGYARVWIGEALVTVHQLRYELERGNVPFGLELDHLCSVRNCVNVNHLEPVTRLENVRRAVLRKHRATDTKPPKVA
jgi:hypothetical protein